MSEFEKVATGLGEECGVFGAYDLDGNDVQHQQSIMDCLPCSTEDRKAVVLQCLIRMVQNEMSHLKKVWDYVMKCLQQIPFRNIKGDIGVGHVRYSTAGASVPENAQPLVLNYVKGTLDCT